MGRAAILYRDNGRKLVLGLKHGDRHDVIPTAALWMARAARPMMCEGMIVAPVPLHWSRLLRRRFNQSAMLAQAIAGRLDIACCPDLLVRHTRTPVLDGLGRDQRHALVSDVFRVHSRRTHHLLGRVVLLVDDVMTSGATLSAVTQVCLAGGAKDVRVLALARVSKDA